jgi:hypothetical protein
MKAPGEMFEEFKMVSPHIQIRPAEPTQFMLINWTIDSSHDNLDNNLNTSFYDDMKINDRNLFKVDHLFEKPWYNSKTKYKLGKLHHSRLKMHSKDKDRDVICRILDLERISAYTLESFEARMKNLLSI